MPINFVQFERQLTDLSHSQSKRSKEVLGKVEKALASIKAYRDDPPFLQAKISDAKSYLPSLRCASPLVELLDATFELPQAGECSSLIAVDGSQTGVNKVNDFVFGVVNTAIFEMKYQQAEVPTTTTRTMLFPEDLILEKYGQLLSEDINSRLRDLEERVQLAKYINDLNRPCIAILDGPIELWFAGEPARNVLYKDCLKAHLVALEMMRAPGVIHTGYIDDPRASYVIRMIEIALASENELRHIGQYHPLQGVSDVRLFQEILQPGQRSAVFSITSRSSDYDLAGHRLNFYFQNVSDNHIPYIARIEIPEWVSVDSKNISNLHACIYRECHQITGVLYPYALLRAHEEAIIRYSDQCMIREMAETILGHEIDLGGILSPKNIAKYLGGHE